MLLVVGLSAAAAFLFALAASLQQHVAHKAYAAERGRARALVRRLPRSPLWLAGWAVNLVGFFVQAAALFFGSVALVQVVLVTQLIYALPLATLWARRWPSLRAWLSGAGICAGVAVFVAVYGSSARSGEADRRAVVLTVLVTAVAVAVLVRASVHRPPTIGAALVAIAAGLCFATSAALMKLTAEDLVHRGIPATAVDWPGYTLALSAFTGVALGQWAYAAGSLPAAVAAMTITNPVASYLIGIVAFGVAPPASPSSLGAVAAAGALISVGVVGLAHSEAVQTAHSEGIQQPPS